MRFAQLLQLLAWFGFLIGATASAVAQIQSAKLVASDTGAEDQFGISVAISGDWLIVGAPFDDDVQSESGAAYVYMRNGSTWVEMQKLKPSTINLAQIFGSSVAINGDVAAIGAPADNQITVNGGAVYVFERQGQQWIQTARLSATDWSTSTNRRLGYSVSVFGDRILAGALDDGSPKDSGAAYVFVRQAGNWSQEAKLEPSDLEVFAQFGTSVALSGDRALIGCPYKDEGGNDYCGAAYIFERRQTGWIQTQKLIAGDPLPHDTFGTSLSLGPTRALIGAPLHNHASNQQGGAAYLFELTDAGWSQTQELLGSDSSFFDIFGITVAIDGDLAVVGAESNDDLGAGFGNGTGAAYTFKRYGDGWPQIAKIVPSDGTSNDSFARSVGLNGATVVVGTPADDPGCSNNCESGSTYTFDLSTDSVQYCSCPSAAPCGNTDNHGGCINSTGFGAILAAAGSASVGADALVLKVDHLRPFGIGMIFMGGGGGSTPFANGIRCVSAGASGIYRFGAQAISDTGTLIQGPGLAAHSTTFPPQGLISAGSTWFFQCWYRDVLGPCGDTSNFSNALAVAFQP